MKTTKIIIFLFILFYGISYGQENFAVEFKLKPNFKDSLLHNNRQLQLLSQKYNNLEFKQSYPGAKTAELLLYYTLQGTLNENKTKTEIVADYLITDLFETSVQEFEHAYTLTSCTNSISVNDPHFQNANRWPLDMIEAPCAWSITTGNPNILIGIADTEFDPTHEDLQNKFAYIIGPVSDGNTHGTRVSTIAAANTNNAIGMASIGYNSKIAARRIDHNSGTNINGAASASFPNSIRDAIWNLYQLGVPIINVSWSSTQLNFLAAKEITENGTTLVVAGGNNSLQINHSTIANIPGVIIVSSVDMNNNYYIEHARNQYIDICAPGKDVLRGNVGNIYQINEGTSLAAPFVAGTIALMLDVNPNLSPDEIEDIIKATADTIANWHLYPGLLGAGRLNAYRAVAKAQAAYSSTLDLYIKDRPEDIGISGGYDWYAARDNPPDMWIRNQPDGRINQTDEAPEYSPGNPIYVYVKVRNKSSVPSIGSEQLRVYWSKSSGWTSWPENWDGTDPSTGNVIGMVNIGSILPGKDSIYEFMWNIYNTFQNGNWHQCLAARIENSATDPITIKPDRFDDDIYFNNNIAAKNVVISDLIPNTTINSCGGYINIGNPTNQLVTQNFSLSESKIQGESGFLREGEITISFDSVGWQFFHPFLANNKEIEILQSGKIKILTSDFRINNIQYPINTVYPIFIEYSLISSRSSKQKRFKLDLQEYLVDTVEIPLGGVYFTINKPDFEKFYAETEKHQIKVNSGDLFKLSAVKQVGNFEYNWYDNNGNLLGSGSSIEASSPDQSATYYLQVLSRDFCITDRSDLSIIVNPNYIVSISPNPANSKIKVEYKLLNVGANSNAQFNIINQFGIIQTTQSINITQNTAEISVGWLLPGTYMLQLMVDNNVSDTEIFIKQ